MLRIIEIRTWTRIETCTSPPRLSLRSNMKYVAPMSWSRFIAAKVVVYFSLTQQEKREVSTGKKATSN